MSTLNLIAPQHELIRAALRCLTVDHARSDDANSDADAEYAYEQLALAARDLTEAVERLEPTDRPVGWSAR